MNYKFWEVMMRLVVVGVLAVALMGCVSSGYRAAAVERLAEGQRSEDLSGRWNDTDSSLTAEKMITSMLDKAWRSNFVKENKNNPVVIVGRMRNNTSEHIDVSLFVKDIESELINSGQINFVASSSERQELRSEREEQQSNASFETMKRVAQEVGADFMLMGEIASQVDQIEGRKVVSYMVSMELVNIESNLKVWSETQKIRKDIQR